MPPPSLELHGPLGLQRADYSRDLRPAEWGRTIHLRCKNREPRMSALGQKRTLLNATGMAALCQEQTSPV
jgi:hypothetical protein